MDLCLGGCLCNPALFRSLIAALGTVGKGQGQVSVLLPRWGANLSPRWSRSSSPLSSFQKWRCIGDAFRTSRMNSSFMPSFIHPALTEVTTGSARSSMRGCKDLKDKLFLAWVECERDGERDGHNDESGRWAEGQPWRTRWVMFGSWDLIRKAERNPWRMLGWGMVRSATFFTKMLVYLGDQ